MCGIVGYVGTKQAAPILLDGLRRLEYRGYDSAGMAVQDPEKASVETLRKVGRVSQLEQALKKHPLSGVVGIAHTRWATHGAPSLRNAHPHQDCSARFHVVHNGIIENYAALREELRGRGHVFSSDTDTEVVAHLIEEAFRGTLEDAVAETLKKLRGTWAFAILARDDPEKIVAARNSSPLLIAIGDNEHLVASDASAALSITKKVVYMEDGEMAVLTKDNFRISNIDDAALRRRLVEIPWTLEEAEKTGHPHFMHKEIWEGPEVIKNALRGRVMAQEGSVRLGGFESIQNRLRHTEHIVLSGMGTAFNAALLGEYFLEEIAGISAEAEYAAEFRYKNIPAIRNAIFVAVSQSGETADTLGALRKAKERGMITLGVVNVVGSTIARETDAGAYNYAGPEIGVASTKAFLSQIAVLTLAALFFGKMFGKNTDFAKGILNDLEEIPDKINKILKKEQEIQKIAEKYSTYTNFLYLGRKWSYPVALEGALKLKEISYLHAEGYNAAEMKHGPIAMIDPSFPTVAIAPNDSVADKTLLNLEEIRARGGPILAIASEGDKRLGDVANDVIYVPKTHELLSPLLTVVPLQLLAYHIGVLKGYDVDKPRNLAKSVTVE